MNINILIMDTLFQILSKIEPTFDEDCQKQLSQKQEDWSQMLLYLHKDIGLKAKQLQKFIDEVIGISTKQQSFFLWNMTSLMTAYVKLKLIESVGASSKNQINQILMFKRNESDMTEFIQALSSFFKFKDFNITEFFQILNQEKIYYHLLASEKCYVPRQIAMENPADTIEGKKQQQLEQLEQKLKIIKERLQDTKGSILDQHFEQHLEKALKEKIRKIKQQQSPQIYSQEHYEKFKGQLISILKQFQLISQDITSELELNLTEAQDYYNKIIKVRNTIHPIYLPDLLMLKNKNDSTKQKTNDKNLVVILGLTGAGKSTAIQMLLGYKMKLLKFSESRGTLTTLVPVGGLKNQHKEFVAKASQCSITKHTSAVEVPFQVDCKKQALFLVDTPGFFDTGGVTVDACNALSTVQVLKKANSIRFIFLLNKNNWGTRGEGFKKMASIISRLFKQFSTKKVIYFLNCYDEQSLKELPIKVKDLKDNLNENEKGDTKFSQVITHLDKMLSQASLKAKSKKMTMLQAIEENDQLVVMDPINPNLNQIFLKIFSINRNWQQPTKFISDNVLSRQAQLAFLDQARTLDIIFRQSQKKKKFDCSFYYLNQLQLLADQTKDLNDFAGAYQRLSQIITKIQSQFENTEKNLFKIVESHKQNIDGKDLDNIKDIFDQYSLSENKMKFVDIKKQRVGNVLQKCLKYLDSKFQAEKNQARLKALLTFVEKFQINQIKKAKQIELLKKKAELEKNINNFLENQNFQKAIFQIQSYQNIVILLEVIDVNKSNFDYESKLKDKIEKAQQYAKEIIKRKAQETQIQIFKEEDIFYLKDFFKKMSTSLDEKKDQLKNLIRIKNEIIRKISKLITKYLDCLRKIQRKSLEELIQEDQCKKARKAKLNIQKLFQLKQIEIQRNQQFKHVQNRLVSIINVKKKSVRQQTSKIERQKKQINFFSLYNNKKYLQELGKILQQKQQKQLLKVITQSNLTVIEYFKLNEEKLKKTGNLIQKPPKNIETILQIYINSSSFYYSSRDQFIDICRNICQITHKKLRDTLNEINTFCCNQLKSFSEGRNSLEETFDLLKKIIQINKFINNAKEIHYIEEQINISLAKFEKIILDKSSLTLDSLQRIIIEKYGKVKSCFLGEISQLKILRNDFQQIVQLQEIAERVTNNRQFMSLILGEEFFNEGNHQKKKHKKLFQNFCTQLQSLIKQKFQICLKMKDSGSCQNIFQFCQALKIVNNRKFSNLLRSLRQESKLKIDGPKNQNYWDFETLRKIEELNLMQIEKYFKLKRHSQSLLLKLKEKIIKIVEQQQQQIQDKLKDFNKLQNKQILNSQYFNFKKCWDLLSRFRDLIQFTNQVNKIYSPSKISILTNQKKQMLYSFLQKFKRDFVENSKKQFNQLIFQGSFHKAIEVIERIHEIEKRVQGIAKKEIFSGYHAEIQRFDFQHLTLKKELQLKKNQFEKKYFQDQIQVNKQFYLSFSKFEKNAKQKIRYNLEKRLNEKFQSLEKLVKENDEDQIVKQIQRLSQQIASFPYQIKHRLHIIGKKWQKKILDSIHQEKELGLKKYNIKQSLELLILEKRKQIKKIYEEQTFIYFKSLFQNIINGLIEDLQKQLFKALLDINGLQKLNQQKTYHSYYQSFCRQLINFFKLQIFQNSYENESAKKLKKLLPIFDFFSLNRKFFPFFSEQILDPYLEMLNQTQKKQLQERIKLSIQSLEELQEKYKDYLIWKQKFQKLIESFQAMQNSKSEYIKEKLTSLNLEITKAKQKENQVQNMVTKSIEKVKQFSLTKLKFCSKFQVQKIMKEYKQNNFLLKYLSTKAEFNRIKAQINQIEENFLKQKNSIIEMCKQQIEYSFCIKHTKDINSIKDGTINFFFILKEINNNLMADFDQIRSILEKSTCQFFKQLSEHQEKLVNQTQKQKIKRGKKKIDEKIFSFPYLSHTFIHPLIQRKQASIPSQNIQDQKLWKSLSNKYWLMISIIFKITKQITIQSNKNMKDLLGCIKKLEESVGFQVFSQILLNLDRKNFYLHSMLLQIPLFQKYSKKYVNRDQQTFQKFLNQLKIHNEKKIIEFQIVFQNYFQKSLSTYQQTKDLNPLLQQIRIFSQKGLLYYHSNYTTLDPAPFLGSLYAFYAINVLFQYKKKAEIINFIDKPSNIQKLLLAELIHLDNPKSRRSLNPLLIQLQQRNRGNVAAIFSAYLALNQFEVYIYLDKSKASVNLQNRYHQFFTQLRIEKRIKIIDQSSICKIYMQQIKIYIQEIILQKKCIEGYNVWQNLKPMSIFHYMKSFFSQKEVKFNERTVLVAENLDDFFDAENLTKKFIIQSSPILQNFGQTLHKVYEVFSSQFEKKQAKELIRDRIKGFLTQYFQNQNITQQFETLLHQIEKEVQESVLSLFQKRGPNKKSEVYSLKSFFNSLRDNLYAPKFNLAIPIAQTSFLEIVSKFKSIFGFVTNFNLLPAEAKEICINYQITNPTKIDLGIQAYARILSQLMKPIIVQQQHLKFNQITKMIQKQVIKGKAVIVIFENLFQAFLFNSFFLNAQKQSNKAINICNDFESCLNFQKICKKQRVTFIKPFTQDQRNSFVLYSEFIDIQCIIIQTFVPTKQTFDPIKNKKLQEVLIISKKQLSFPLQNLNISSNEIIMREKQQQNRILQSMIQRKQVIRENFFKINKQNVLKTVQRLNKFPQQFQKSIKTVILFDFSTPMKSIFSIFPWILYSVAKQLIQKDTKQKHLIQICFYRNYNIKERQILIASQFEVFPYFLYKFCNLQKVGQTLKNSALEVAFNYLVSLETIDKVILISMTSPNNQSQAKSCRQFYGKSYWQNNNLQLSPKEQYEKLINKKIPIDCICIGGDKNAQQYYKNLSNKTGGQIIRLEIGKNFQQLLIKQIFQRFIKIQKSSSDSKKSSPMKKN